MEDGEFFLCDIGDEGLLRGIGLAEVVEDLAFEKIEFLADWGAECDFRVVFVGIDGELGVGSGFQDGCLISRQSEVSEEIGERLIPKRFLKAEVVEKDMGFQRILRGREFHHMILASGEESGVRLRVAVELRGLCGAELGKISEVEFLHGEQGRGGLCQFIELRNRESGILDG